VIGAVRNVKRAIGPMVSAFRDGGREIGEPHIVTGSDLLSKDIYVEGKGIGVVSDIVEGELDPAPGPELGVAGSSGAVFLDKSRQAKASVIFDSSGGRVEFVDIDGDQVCEFMNRGDMLIGVSLIDHQGSTLWTHGGKLHPKDMGSGDVDGDGTLEFAAGFTGTTQAVHLLTDEGDRIWSKSAAGVACVALADTDGDGKDEIVHSNSGGQCTIRNSEGKPVKTLKMSMFFQRFSICDRPGGGRGACLLVAEEGNLRLIDFAGKTLAEYPASECVLMAHAEGTAVKLDADKPDYFAALVNSDMWPNSILYVYDGDNELVYQEVLPEIGHALSTMAVANSSAEDLLVGGEGRVWRYRVAGAVGAASGTLEE
jgi:hypothetical protein